MMRRHAGRVPALAVVALLCGAMAFPCAAAPGATDAYRLALLKMKAHLGVARALLRQNAPGVDEHLSDAVAEIYANAGAELEKRRAAVSADIVQQLQAAARAGSPLAIENALETAFTAVDGSLARAGPLGMASALDLAATLFREALVEYRRAVSDNEVVSPMHYRTGAGYVAVGSALTRRARRVDAHGGYARLRDAVALLREAWPGVVPPGIANDPSTVAGWVEDVVSAMDALR